MPDRHPCCRDIRSFVPFLCGMLIILSGCYSTIHLQAVRYTRIHPDRIMPVQQVQVSPDGRRVLFTMTAQDAAGVQLYERSQVYMANTDGSGVYQIVSGRQTYRYPRWSPDGKHIAFIASGEAGEMLTIMRSNGSEMWPLTRPYRKIAGFQWAPDGARIACIRPDSGSEQVQEAPDTDPGRMNRVWIIPFDPMTMEIPDAPPLTGGEMHVVISDQVTGLDWSPDGAHIAFVHRAAPEDWTLNDISTIDVTTGTITPLACTDRSEITPFYSPDGRWIAYAASKSEGGATAFDMHLVSVNGQDRRRLAATPDSWPTLIGWNRDGKSVYVTEQYGGITHISSLPIDGSRPRDISLGDRRMQGVTMNATRTMLGFTATEASGQPFGVYITPMEVYRPIPIRYLPNPVLPDRLRW